MSKDLILRYGKKSPLPTYPFLSWPSASEQHSGQNMAEHSAAAVAVAELRVDHRLMLRLGPGAGVTWEDIHHRSYQFKMVHIYLYIYTHI